MRWNLLCLAALTLLGLSAGQDCSDVIETAGVDCSCQCSASLLNCTGCTTFPTLKSDATAITTFEFNNCNFPTLTKESLNYPSAAFLAITNSHVRNISADAFSTLAELKVLQLDNNNLTDNITKSAFNGLSQLGNLVLQNCTLYTLPSDIWESLPSIAELQLSYNRELHLPDDFFSSINHSLTLLDMSKMGWTELPSAVTNAGDNIKSLQLHGNLLKPKAGFFQGLTSLQHVNVDNCGLGDLPEGFFAGLSSMVWLSIGNNGLRALPTKLLAPMRESLRVLHAERNHLRSLEEDALRWDILAAEQSGAKHTDLGGNPFLCDCHMAWVSHLPDTVSSWNMTCSAPEELAGQNATEVVMARCSVSSYKSKVALGIVIPILIICTLLIGYYLYRIVQSRRRRARQRKHIPYSSVYRDTVEQRPAAGGAGAAAAAPPRPSKPPQRANLV